ncbi:MAG TPA: HesA/MoeB/ThiF family protein [Steroidobacteraceae bacterium]|jgi:sulfur-carrier protein adenylyltransferase/sulfurtransferase|nr:HesA/MoeB/ThiF family protein [Steroidobacteraceae bacterium]
MNASTADRYARQIVLPEVGAAGQARLAAARVLVVGAGGLGCAVLQYLTAAGVGTLTVVDHDRVEESNLHRQPLYRMSDLGQLKASAACATLTQLNPHVRLQAVTQRLSAANAAALVSAAQLVLDAADSFAVTYMLSDACQQSGVPLVSASVLGLAGYVGVFCGGAPSYRAVFPDMPGAAGSCAESGVLGSAVGVLGTLQAHLALALLLDWQPAVRGRLLSLDLRTLRFGGFSFTAAAEPQSGQLTFISPAEVVANDVVIDLRSAQEAPRSPFAQAVRLDVETLERGGATLPQGARVVLCCRSGVRAWRAARALERCGHRDLALIALGE